MSPPRLLPLLMPDMTNSGIYPSKPRAASATQSEGVPSVARAVESSRNFTSLTRRGRSIVLLWPEMDQLRSGAIIATSWMGESAAHSANKPSECTPSSLVRSIFMRPLYSFPAHALWGVLYLYARIAQLRTEGIGLGKVAGLAGFLSLVN